MFVSTQSPCALSRSAKARTAKPLPRGRATKKRAPFGARFFLVHFQGLSRLRRVAAVCAPWGPPAALRRCPALRLAVSATSGARLRAPRARISGPMESGSPGSKTNEKDHPIGWSFSFGALLDEAVKKNLPWAGFLGRESLRAEPERKSANGKAAPQGGRATKKRAPFPAS